MDKPKEWMILDLPLLYSLDTHVYIADKMDAYIADLAMKCLAMRKSGYYTKAEIEFTEYLKQLAMEKKDENI